jgi:hypothetical protein
MPDVGKCYKAIPRRVRRTSFLGTKKKYLGARNTGLLIYPDYTTDKQQYGGAIGALLGGCKEHFQGVQRIGRHLIVSGGIAFGERRSQLIVIEMGSRDVTGPWSLPRYGHWDDPLPEDRIVYVHDIDRTRWHAGGIQMLDRLVAVPIYGDDADSSEVRFFRIDETGKPHAVAGATLEKPGMKAKAVGLARVAPTRCLLAAWDDECIDFHVADSESVDNGVKGYLGRVTRHEIGGPFNPAPGAGTYQSINLVTDVSGTVYLLATRNSALESPKVTGSDWLDLYALEWRPDTDLRPEVKLVDMKQMYCYDQQCNFGAAAGIYVYEQHVYVYATAHWLHDGNARLNFNEYAYE